MQNRKIGKAKRILIILFSFSTIIVGSTVLIGLYYPLRYVDFIDEYADEYGLEPEFVCAVIHAESKFNKEAVSRKGASGLMQIMEGTAYWIASIANIQPFDYGQIFEPKINIRIGCYYLRWLIDLYGDKGVALCAYNAGNGNVDKWLENPDYSDNGKTLTFIPYPETRNYVKKVSSNEVIYSFIFKFVKIQEPHRTVVAAEEFSYKSNAFISFH